MTDLKKKANENECQYLWRIKSAIDKHEVTWREVTPIINRELFGDDEEEYRDESAYRKRVKSAEEFLSAGVFAFTEDEYIKRLEEERRELAKAQTRFRDERNAWNRQNREMARVEEKLDYLEELISSTSPYHSPQWILQKDFDANAKSLLVCVSDVHLGLDTGDTPFGEYSVEAARDSFLKYADSIICIMKQHDVENVYIALLGDLCNGVIHYTTILENGENVVAQVQHVSELVAEFIHTISVNASTVFVNNVGGNHSRLGKKNEVLRDERLDDIVLWYCKAKLSNVKNVKFIDSNKYDPTLAFFDIDGMLFLLCHGDFDSPDISGIQRLTMMIGEVPYAVVMGHRHGTMYNEVSGVKVIQSGTFAGSGSNYCIERRLVGQPSQAVAVIGKRGIEAFYPVQL